MGEVWQFWSRQITIVVLAGLAFVVLILVAGSSVRALPRDAYESLFGGFCTLLGLTFAAFAILLTFTPGLRADFVRSKTFGAMAGTFVLTMVVELTTIVLAGLAISASGEPWDYVVGSLSILLGLVSLGLVGQLVRFMAFLFRVARKTAQDSA